MDWIKTAKVGDRVCCIRDDWDWNCTCGIYSVPVRVPMINEVLTIAGMCFDDGLKPGSVALWFEEIDKRQVDGDLSATVVYSHFNFIPVIEVKTSIEIFTRMLTKVTEDA